VPPSILVAVAALVAGAIAWKLVRRGLGDARFVVEIRGPGTEGVHLQGQVPGKSGDEVVEFVAKLDLPTGAKFWGVPERNRLQLHFAGEVPEHLQQRIRNYVYN